MRLYRLNSMGQTPTLGMRLSCNFVNVFTIVHVYMRASPTDILARKSARRTKVRGQVSELNRLHASWQADCRGATDFRAAEVGEEVCVSVVVRVGPVEFRLIRTE